MINIETVFAVRFGSMVLLRGRFWGTSAIVADSSTSGTLVVVVVVRPAKAMPTHLVTKHYVYLEWAFARSYIPRYNMLAKRHVMLKFETIASTGDQIDE